MLHLIPSLLQGKCVIWRYWATLLLAKMHLRPLCCSHTYESPLPGHYLLKSHLFYKFTFCGTHILCKVLQEKDQAFFQSKGEKIFVHVQWTLPDLYVIIRLQSQGHDRLNYKYFHSPCLGTVVSFYDFFLASVWKLFGSLID